MLPCLPSQGVGGIDNVPQPIAFPLSTLGPKVLPHLMRINANDHLPSALAFLPYTVGFFLRPYIHPVVSPPVYTFVASSVLIRDRGFLSPDLPRNP